MVLNREIISMIEKLVFSKTKVPFLAGAPGIGKTEIAYAIAKKNNLRLVDLRVAQLDEVDIAGVIDIHSCKEYFTYKIPDWAFFTTKAQSEGFKGTLVFFDELNRAQIEKLNATLRILNERALNHVFKFPENTYFLSAGNLGEEDHTEVNELEAATIDRLAIIRLETDVSNWVIWAKDNDILEVIVDFISTYPGELYSFPKVESSLQNFATPRSWAKLSKFLSLSSKNSEEMLSLTISLGDSFVGVSSIKFSKYLEDRLRISFKDILEGNVDLSSLDKSKQNELVQELFELNLEKLAESKIKNIIQFIESCYDDLKIAIISKFEETLLEKECYEKTSAFKILRGLSGDLKRYYKSTLPDSETK